MHLMPNRLLRLIQPGSQPAPTPLAALYATAVARTQCGYLQAASIMHGYA